MSDLTVDPFVEVQDTEAQSTYVRIDADETGVATVTIDRAGQAERLQRRGDRRPAPGLRDPGRSRRRAGGVRHRRGGDLLRRRRSRLDARGDGPHRVRQPRRRHGARQHAQEPARSPHAHRGAGRGRGLRRRGGAGRGVRHGGRDQERARSPSPRRELGLVAATISPYVVAAIGPRRARGLLASARVFDAEHACASAWSTRWWTTRPACSPPAKPSPPTPGSCGPEAVRASKRLVDHVAAHHLDHGLIEHTAREIARARVSPEGQEGVRAFLERRRPGWLES